MKLPERSFTTAIGSLPHHNVDAALTFAFSVDLPFLPQIPIRNPWEFMIAQVLEGMPGLQVEKDGSVTLDMNVWTGRMRAFNEKLQHAFESPSNDNNAFEPFEPSAATYSSWQPFLWELHERGVKMAKIQVAGPLTAQWVLRSKDGSDLQKSADVTSQIFRLVLARALAMSRRLRSDGVQPVLFLDEPGLYCYSQTNPRHAMAFQELKLTIQSLKKEGVIVGLHCCSDTDWAAVLGLGLDLVSIDTGLSLEKLLHHREALKKYLVDGGRLSLGVVPTSNTVKELRQTNIRVMAEQLWKSLKTGLGDDVLVANALGRAFYTPACGLALLGIPEAEQILENLQQFHSEISNLVRIP